jgi:hypothetical protein
MSYHEDFFQTIDDSDVTIILCSHEIILCELSIVLCYRVVMLKSWGRMFHKWRDVSVHRFNSRVGGGLIAVGRKFYGR